jgi:hypothetical protein
LIFDENVDREELLKYTKKSGLEEIREEIESDKEDDLVAEEEEEECN